MGTFSNRTLVISSSYSIKKLNREKKRENENEKARGLLKGDSEREREKEGYRTLIISPTFVLEREFR